MSLFDAVVPLSRIQRQLRLATKLVNESDAAMVARRDELLAWAGEHRTRLRMGVAVGIGRRSIQIAHRAQADVRDLIVVAPDGSPEDLAVVRRIIRVAPCPVLVLRQPMDVGSVIAAIDPDDQMSLNTMIARTATGLARPGGRELHVVHAYEPHGLRLLRRAATERIAPEDLDSFVDTVRDAHRAALDEVLDHIGVDATSHVEVGSTLDVIARSIVETDANVVVVGLGGHPGVPSILAGNTADRIINRTLASVLVVRAPGLSPTFDVVDDEESFSASGPSAVVTAFA
jgi:nucleotide-binding universal stress UspA family protein